MKITERIRGGLYGLLVGDALGVPYEFNRPENLPPVNCIEMIPPKSFVKTYEHVLPGTWSDDGAQALCLLESLLDCGKLDVDDLGDKLLGWLNEGRWAVGGVVFDVGNQTMRALRAYAGGISPEKSGSVEPEGKGNGALMRTLPLALWSEGSDKDLAVDAHRQSAVTHGHVCNQVCCSVYCLTARYMLNGQPFSDALDCAVKQLNKIYENMDYEYIKELKKLHLNETLTGSGTGYVVDCLKSSFMIMEKATNYEDAVRQAIALGNDTDTTACVTGGLAGITFGFDGIPKRWLESLREKEKVEELLVKLNARVSK